VIAKAEWVAFHERGAVLSAIARLFGEAQPEPFAQPLSPPAREIALTLLGIAENALPTRAMYQASLARYALRVLAHCF
jgi:hypothetical protein